MKKLNETNINIPPDFKGQLQIKVIPTWWDAFNIGTALGWGIIVVIGQFLVLLKVLQYFKYL